MQWGLFILALAGCFSAGISFHIYKETDRFKFLGLFFASIFFIIINIGLILSPLLRGDVSSVIISWIIQGAHICCVALVLSSLLLFVRESKPSFMRFPILYAASPLVIIISYVLVYDTIVLKNWLLNIYEAGAVAASLLIYGFYCYHRSVYRTIFIGTVLFLTSLILYFVLPVTYEIIWQILLAIAIGTAFSGYLQVESQSKQFN